MDFCSEDVLLHPLDLFVLQLGVALHQGGPAALAGHQLGGVGLGDLQMLPLHLGGPWEAADTTKP